MEWQEILGIVLIVLGVIYVYFILTRPSWLMNNFKVKAMVKMMGVKGFWIFMYVFTAIVLIAGILLYN